MNFVKKKYFLIAGLGNPGTEYGFTRHNAGFMFLESIVGLEFRNGFGSLYAKKDDVIFVKPQSFMNLSGSPMAEIMTFYKIPKENIIVIYDDVSIEFGKIRFRQSGSSGGHNGIKDIIRVLGTDNFRRIKIGIGPAIGDLTNFVLSKFRAEEILKLKEIFKDIENMIDMISHTLKKQR
jgi:PTH1 family peptidyl-tRNA hydrolase